MFNGKQLRALIIPLIIEQFLAIAVGAADTVMVSACGEAAVSAVSLVDSINILLINIFSALATGGAVVASQFIGRQEPQQANTSARQLIYSVSALSVMIAVFALIFRRPILSGIFGTVEPEVMENALTYFWLSVVSYPFLAVYNSGAALFRSMGNSRISMMVSLLMNLVNITGNAILIYGFNMGVAGAATASLFSRILAAVMMLALLRDVRRSICVRGLLKVKLNFPMIGAILRIGVPNGVENGIFQVGKLMVASLVAGFGTTAIAANAVGNTLCQITIIPGVAIGLAMVTVVGQCVGAGDYVQTRRYVRLLMRLTYITMLVMELAVILLSGQLVQFFNLTPETGVLAQKLLLIHNLMAIVFWPPAFTLPNALRAAGDAKFTMVVSMVSVWACRIGFSFLLGRTLEMGVTGVWIAMTLDWVARTAFFVWRYCGKRWEQKKLI